MRLSFIRRTIIICFVILILYLWYMQCVQRAHYMELSWKNRIRLVPLTAPRGNIYDRNGNLLVGNRLAFDCAVIPQEFPSGNRTLQELSSILQISTDTLKKRIKENAVASFIAVTLKRDIGKEAAIAISERSIDIPGLIIHTYPARYYPSRNVGSHVTGYLGKISEEELYALRDYGYKARDFIGRGGLELIYDNYLKGDEGGIQTEVDSQGRELKVLGIKEPEKGRDITLTIDLDMERYIDSLLEDYRGAVIVIDSQSGEILSLVSKPDFDPNIFVSSGNAPFVKKLLKRRDYPLVNRAISGTYPPGSVFKIVTASAGLGLGEVGASEHLDCKGFYILGNRRFNCWKSSGHNFQTITEGIKNSCNVFFYQLGRKIGVDGMADYTSRYGFGRPTEIDLPYESSGIVPTKAWKRRERKESWFDGDTVNYSIGQGYLLVTPIQILRMINVVATEGELVRPLLVKNIGLVEVSSPEKKKLNISKAIFTTIKEGIGKAVKEKGGTARRAGVKGLRIAGKTGTAQTGGELTHAWFAGFSPIKKPKISIVVFLEYGGKGGDKPSRIAAKIFKRLKEAEYL